MDIDSKKFPRVAAYLSKLPLGLDSYPDCRASASLYRQFLDERPLGELAAGELPEQLLKIIRSRLSVGSWVEECRSVAIALAVADFHRMSDGEFVAFNRELNGKYLGGRFFKVLMSVASPGILLSGAPVRWNAIHRGTKMFTRPNGKVGAEVKLSFPANLYDPLTLRCMSTAFDAALSLSNAKTYKVELVEWTAEQGIYKAEWA